MGAHTHTDLMRRMSRIGERMLTRIRLDAFGETPGAVTDTLYPHANLIEEMLGREISRGEFVVERCLPEPDDSEFAFKGRLVLHVPLL